MLGHKQTLRVGPCPLSGREELQLKRHVLPKGIGIKIAGECGSPEVARHTLLNLRNTEVYI